MSRPVPIRLLILFAFCLGHFAVVNYGLMAAPVVSPQYLRIGGGAVNGGGFAIAGAIAGVLSSPPGGPSCKNGGSCGIPGMIAIVRSIPKLNERLAALNRREIDLLLVTGSEARLVKDQPGIRVIAGLTTQVVQIIVPMKSRIKSLQQLHGRRLALVDSDSSEGDDGANSFIKKWAEMEGLSGAYFITKASSNGETGLAVALKALEKNQIEALVVFGAVPNPEISAYALSQELRFLSLRPRAGNSPLAKIIQPAGLYNGQPQLTTIGSVSQLVVRTDMPRELVYSICRSIWEPHSLKSYGTVTASKGISLENAQLGLQWKLHSGAQKFYRELAASKNTSLSQKNLKP